LSTRPISDGKQLSSEIYCYLRPNRYFPEFGSGSDCYIATLLSYPFRSAYPQVIC